MNALFIFKTHRFDGFREVLAVGLPEERIADGRELAAHPANNNNESTNACRCSNSQRTGHQRRECRPLKRKKWVYQETECRAVDERDSFIDADTPRNKLDIPWANLSPWLPAAHWMGKRQWIETEILMLNEAWRDLELVLWKCRWFGLVGRSWPAKKCFGPAASCFYILTSAQSSSSTSNRDKLQSVPDHANNFICEQGRIINMCKKKPYMIWSLCCIAIDRCWLLIEVLSRLIQ